MILAKISRVENDTKLGKAHASFAFAAILIPLMAFGQYGL
jgi:hypothetical protein